MRTLRVPTFFFFVLSACSSGNSTDNGTDGGPPGDGAPIPPTETCAGDMTTCIAGTVAASGFTVAFQQAKVDLYRTFPSGNTMPVASVPVAKDNTFALSNVAPWGHYYVEVVAKFPGVAQNPTSIRAVRGPIVVPDTTGQNAKMTLTVKPVEAELLQIKSATMPSMVETASAHVFDPSTGAELTDAKVTLVVGGMSVPMPWGANMSGTMSYYVVLTPALAAAASYTIQATHPSFAQPASWQLAPSEPAYDAAITTPADASQIAVGQSFDVTWTPQPMADYGVVELFARNGQAFTTKYVSAGSLASDVGKDTVPGSAVAAPGMYLVNLLLVRANCPATSDGCVYAASVGTANLTAK